MEEEKKKKRNKKKKNKQSKIRDEIVVIGGGREVASALGDQNGQDDQGHVSESANVQDADVYLNTNGSNGGTSSILAESEKRQCHEREAVFKERTRELQTEKNFHIQKEAMLEETIRQLQTEKDFHIQKEATLEDTINQLREENNLHLQREFTFEEMIKKLRDENGTYFQNKASLEMKIVQLHNEKDSWLQKEVSLQERVKHLEREKHYSVLKEDLTKETIANLNNDIAGLRVQVVELQESKNNLLQENQQLMENISRLQLQINDLRSIASARSSEEFTELVSEREKLNAQVEAACALVEKLVAENAELVEKVNELFVELDRHTGSSGLPSTVASELVVGTSEKTYSFPQQGSETKEHMPILGQELNSVELVPVGEEMNSICSSDIRHTCLITEPSISEVSGEIVQIPLDENEARDLDIQVLVDDENAALPISDAPLIGAPFRLISFVSRYVSGADLVNRSALQA